MLSVSLRQRFGSFELDVAFQAPDGITVLFGGSGSGKTTVVNAVAGLMRPEAGHVSLGERILFDTNRQIWLPPQRRRVGYIFQEARLFPHLSVRQNLLFGRWFAPQAATQENLDQIVEVLGISSLLSRRPRDLSGGEKQRVAIGRALLRGPELILADEPLAALDDARKEEILPYFERLRDVLKIPMLYVSHSAGEVARLATSVVVLKDGKILRQGTPAEVLGDVQIMPTGVRAAGALLHAKVKFHHPDGLSELDAGGIPLLVPQVKQAPGTELRIRILAQDVILSRKKPEGLSALNILAGVVEEIRTGAGPGAMVSLRTDAGRILARITRRSAQALDLEPGVSCYAVVKSVSIARGDISGVVSRSVSK